MPVNSTHLIDIQQFKHRRGQTKRQERGILRFDRVYIKAWHALSSLRAKNEESHDQRQMQSAIGLRVLHPSEETTYL